MINLHILSICRILYQYPELQIVIQINIEILDS